MKRALVAVSATLTLALGLSAQASAATPNATASCSAKISASLAGQAGARADIALGVIEETQSLGLPPGAFQSEVAVAHQPLEVC
jgi:hypothetical protein